MTHPVGDADLPPVTQPFAFLECLGGPLDGRYCDYLGRRTMRHPSVTLAQMEAAWAAGTEVPGVGIYEVQRLDDGTLAYVWQGEP